MQIRGAQRYRRGISNLDEELRRCGEDAICRRGIRERKPEFSESA